MVLNQLTIDKEYAFIHIWRDRWCLLAGGVATGSELGLAVHLLPVLGSRTLLLLSSLLLS